MAPPQADGLGQGAPPDAGARPRPGRWALPAAISFTLIAFLLSRGVGDLFSLAVVAAMFLLVSAVLHFFAQRNPAVRNSYGGLAILFLSEGLTGALLIALAAAGLYWARYVAVAALQLAVVAGACLAAGDLGALGLRRPKSWWSLAWAVVIGAFFGLLLALAGEGVMEGDRAMPVSAFLNAAALAPLAEELMYRGLLYSRVRRDLPGGAVYAVSAVFALAHLKRGLSLAAIGGIFAYAVVATESLEGSGSMASPLVMHSAANVVIYSGLIEIDLLPAWA